MAYDADRLVDVAVRVFLERGYDGTSMEDVARAAGLSKSSIYHHVAGKEELLRRALDRALDAFDAILTEPQATRGDSVARLRYIVRRSVEILTHHVAEIALLVRVRGNSETERRALDRRRSFDAVLVPLIRRAERNGAIRTDLDPKLTTRLIFGMVNSVAEWYRPDGGVSAQTLAEAVERIIFTTA